MYPVVVRPVLGTPKPVFSLQQKQLGKVGLASCLPPLPTDTAPRQRLLILLGSVPDFPGTLSFGTSLPDAVAKLVVVVPDCVMSDRGEGGKNQEGRTVCSSCGGSGRPSLEALTPAASRLSAFLDSSSWPTFFPAASMLKSPPRYEKSSWPCHTQP